MNELNPALNQRRRFPDRVPKLRLNMELECELVRHVDTFGYQYQIPSRRGAVEQLLRLGLGVVGRLRTLPTLPQQAQPQDKEQDTQDAE